jgi:hypothetical protein
LGSRGGGQGGQAPRRDSEYSQAAPAQEEYDAPPAGPAVGGGDEIPF